MELGPGHSFLATGCWFLVVGCEAQLRVAGCGLPAIVRLRRTQARRAGLRGGNQTNPKSKDSVFRSLSSVSGLMPIPGMNSQLHILQHPPGAFTILLIIGFAGFNDGLNDLVTDPVFF